MFKQYKELVRRINKLYDEMYPKSTWLSPFEVEEENEKTSRLDRQKDYVIKLETQVDKLEGDLKKEIELIHKFLGVTKQTVTMKKLVKKEDSCYECGADESYTLNEEVTETKLVEVNKNKKNGTKQK
jgi:hypothetical protein